MTHTDAAKSIIQVGKGGRGFVIASDDEKKKYIVTAAHCLPRLPPAHSLSFAEERTYSKLLGPLGTKNPMVWTECLFVDPCSDIAVLVEPDTGLPEEWEVYDDFVEQIPPLSMRLCKKGERAWLFALDRKRWVKCEADGEATVRLEKMAQPTRGGMSGSPIVGDDGKVIAVCCIGSEIIGAKVDLSTHVEGPNPGVLTLPGWLLKQLGFRI